MTTYKILHCADLHIDSPLRGLATVSDAPAAHIRNATREAFENLIRLAIDEQVKIVLIAGDIFDGDWQDWNTGQFFVRGLARLDQHNIRTVAISGNHDAASVITRDLRRSWPSGATLLPHSKPDTVTFDDLDLSVHGRSFPTKAVTDDDFVTDYPARIEGRLNIGLLHTALEEQGVHERYAPCKIQQLRDFGYGYWALGHIHHRSEVCSDPWIVFPGNLQGRHINEQGEKGATLITVQGRKIIDVTHRVLDVVRWKKIDIDVTTCNDADSVEATAARRVAAEMEAASPRLLAARLRFYGASPAHAALLRDPGASKDRLRNTVLATLPAGATWLERIDLETTAPAAAIPRDDSAQPLLHLIETLDAAALLPVLRGWTSDLLGKAAGIREHLPQDHPALFVGADELPPILLTQARALLRSRLSGG